MHRSETGLLFEFQRCSRTGFQYIKTKQQQLGTFERVADAAVCSACAVDLPQARTLVLTCKFSACGGMWVGVEVCCGHVSEFVKFSLAHAED